MTKLKEWKVAVNQRLSVLEAAIKNRSSKPPSTTHTSTEGTQADRSVQPESTILSLLKKILKYGGIGVALVATPLGVVTGYLALVPKITVTESAPLNADNPFTAGFIVSNDGPLGLNLVVAMCRVAHVRYEDPTITSSNNMIAQQLDKQRMEVGERLTLSCPYTRMFNLGIPILGADIFIEVTARPDFTWRHLTRIAHFVTVADSDHHLHWYPEPSTLQIK